MSEQLKIFVTPVADTSSQTTENLNKQIRQIQSKLNALELKTNIDNNTLKALKEFTAAMGKYQSNLKNYNDTVKETTKITQHLNGNVTKVTQEHKRSGEIIQRTTQKIKEQTTETNKLASAQQKLGQVVKNTERMNAQGKVTGSTQKNRDGYKDFTYNLDEKGNVKNSTVSTNFDKKRKDIDALNASLQRLREQGILSDTTLSSLGRKINLAQSSAQIDSLKQKIRTLDDKSSAVAKNNELKQTIALYQRQAQLNANNLTSKYGNNLSNQSKAQIQEYLLAVTQLTSKTPALSSKIKDLNMQFRELSSSIQNSTQRATSFGQQLGDAFSRIPAYLLSGSIFYGAITALKNITQQAIEIDTLMTNIRRVMDLPDYKFNELLQTSLDLSNELSNKVSDVLEITGSFGRMGFQADELSDLTKTAQVLQNISDLSATDTVNSLTAAMLNFNISAKDSIQIADKLNEVDNNFSITTLDLTNSIRRAGSTAATFGVELNDLIGYTAAIGSTTRESGNIVGNSLKTIFARIGNNRSSIKALDQIGISVQTAAGEAKTSSQLIGEVAEKWDSLSDAQKQNTSIGVAGIYQLSRFNALLNNYSIYQDAANTSANSMGSAWKEQEKYADSLQARINRLQNTVTEFAVAASDAFISDGLIASTEALGNFMGLTTGLVKNIGFLAPAFGTATVATLLFSSALRSTSMQSGVKIINTLREIPANLQTYSLRAATTTATTNILSHSFAALGKAARSAGLFLAGTALPIAAFAALGFVIEKLVSTYADAKKAQEEFETAQKTSVEAWTTNKEATQGLIDKYKELRKAKEDNQLTPEKEQEYLSVSQQLAATFPNLVEGYDTQGNAIIKNNKALKEAIKYTEEMANFNKRDLKDNAASNFEDQIMKLKDLNKEMEANKALADNYKEGSSWITRMFENPFANDDDYVKEGYKFEREALRAKQSIVSANAEIQASVLDVISAFNSIDINPNIKKSITDILNTMDFSKLSPEQLKSFSQQVAVIMDSLQKSLNNGNGSEFDKQTASLKSLITEFSDGKLKVDDLNLSYSTLKDSLDQAKNAGDSAKVTWNENGEGVDELGESVGNLSDKLKEVKGDIEATVDVLNQLVKSGQTTAAMEALQGEVYDDLADQMSPLNDLLEKMAEGKSISASEAMKLIQKEKGLSEAISVENGVVKINRDAVVKLRNVKLKAYNDMQQSVKQDLLNQANATAKKIKNYGLEVKTIQTVADAQSNLASLKKKIDDGGARNPTELLEMDKQYGEMSDITSQLEDLDKMSELVNSSLTEVGTSYETMSDSADKASESTKNSIYVADKYKEALERVNKQIEEQNRKTNDYPKWSQKYRDSIKKEIKALERKEKLLKSQIKLLKEQIKSGYIAQTGIVDSSSSYSPSSSSYSASGGSYSGKYSNVINQAASKYNVPAALIAAVIKQESNFNPNARSHAGATGLMQLMPATARGLGVKNSRDPYQNVMGGTKYLKQMLDKFGSIEKALAAYNAGPGNVTKYGGIPPFSETKNYVKKVNSYFKQMGGSLSSSGGSAAGYYDSMRRTSHFGQQEKGLRSAPHKGLDLAAKSGTPIKSLKSGKVLTAAYSKSAGYWVVVQQDDGTVAKYMHMQKGLNVKAGQKVQAGQTLGKMGSTGHSTGTHLHMQIEKNGKAIDPEAYMQQIGSDLSSSEAERQQAISQVKSDLLGLEGDLSSVKDQIQDLQYEIVQSKLDEFEKRKSDLELKVAQNQSKASRYLNDSAQFRKYTNEQRKAVEAQQKIQSQKVSWINKELKQNKQLNAAQRDQLREELKQAKLDLISIKDQVYELQATIVQSKTDQILNNIDKSVKKTESKLKNVDIKIQTTEEDKDKVKYYSQQIKLIQQQQKEAAKYIKDLEKQKKAAKGFPEIQKQISDEISSWKDKQKDFNLELYQTKKSIKDIYKSLADEVVSIYKEMYEKMRDIELEAHRKATQDIIDGIDKEDDEAKFQKDLKDRQESIQKLLDQINQYALDDSEFGKSKVKELTEQMQKEQLDLDQFLKDRENSKRKEALQDQLEKDEKSINTKYDDLVNDERGFKDLEGKLMNGKISDINKQLSEFTKFINSNMESIGKSISNNLIDKLKEASNALGVVVKGNTTGQKIARFKTGGSVGKVPAQGALAVVDDGEIVLNKQDSVNMLKAVETVRDISQNDVPFTPKWGTGQKLSSALTSVPTEAVKLAGANIVKSAASAISIIPSAITKLTKAPQSTVMSSVSNDQGDVYNLTLQIDKMVGDENGANSAMENIRRGLKQMKGKV
ncbi:phage tail tape measure protein [Bacillus pumilus]|uniref:phage tail tape measure protein n=1 Tax=Bacillus pumilus TaxID=1408 RepID=UPI002282702D|nr:phage tail tape measure protein [Bacillus pumilus]MCY7500081.1 phage tail tape measure protein [Bacillus pumilus]MCY7528595.1 phage tail tape measure protein [Bacillus pumilus]MED4439445.1 phage tail tape measure protein [Bacillus pumilus]MED4489888.1 phage tail tape measure protein [Bacillus pumilus]